MKISVLTPDLSQNCLGRAYLLAKILQRHYDVEIVGAIFGRGIWPPLANLDNIECKCVKIEGGVRAYWQLRELAAKISGDVIYASKPRFSSFGIGLLRKSVCRRPLLLDIDDWEMGFMKEAYKNLSLAERLKALVNSFLNPQSSVSYWNDFGVPQVGLDLLFCEKLTCLADEITVSNNFLKDRFGGQIVWHARDTEALNPDKFDSGLIREKYGIEKNEKTLMFLGTPRRHKGIEDLVEATSLLRRQDVKLIIVGVDDTRYSQNLVRLARQKLGQNIILFGVQPTGKVPEFLAMADIVVIPQRRNLASVGQMPAKVFDAMSMAKAIVATDTSDLPEILDSCGWIIEPERPSQLAATLQYILDHPMEADQKSRKARANCVQKYSWNALEEILISIFRKYE